MTESDSEGVRGIGGLRQFLQSELRANHLLHLAFVGMTVASDARLDLARRITAYGKPSLFRGEQDDAAYFSEAQRSAHIQGGKYGFDGHNLGPEFANQAAEQYVDVMQNRALGGPPALRRHLQRSVMKHAAIAAEHFNDSVASRAGGSWIDPKNAKTVGSTVAGRALTHASKSMSKRGGFQVVVSMENKRKMATIRAGTVAGMENG